MSTFKDPPTWLYKPIQIDNLKEIQAEILPIILKKIPNFISEPPNFYRLLPEDIVPYAPSYVELIKTVGIYDRWLLSAVITTNRGIITPIHVDNKNWQKNCYGLNIPIVNCEGTYTVWYDAEIGDSLYEAGDWRDTACTQKENTPAREIGRWEMSKSAWINVSIPHQAVSTHMKPRAIISARFDPELHEVLYN
jgi:hypothetical protein